MTVNKDSVIYLVHVRLAVFIRFCLSYSENPFVEDRESFKYTFCKCAIKGLWGNFIDSGSLQSDHYCMDGRQEIPNFSDYGDFSKNFFGIFFLVAR